MKLRGVTAAMALSVTLAACTSSGPRSEPALAKLTARQLCEIVVEPGSRLVSWQSSTTAKAQTYLRVTAQTAAPWRDSPATTRAAICDVRDRTGTSLYAVNVNGATLRSRQGIVLTGH